MRAPESITMAEIRDAVFKKRDAMFLGAELSTMYECFCDKRDPNKVTVLDIVLAV
jgi:hypothetical protein